MTTETTDPLVPLLKIQERAASIAELYALTLGQLPKDQHDNVTVLVEVNQQGARFGGVVTVQDVDGFVLGSWDADGDRSLVGGFRWRIRRR